MKRRVIILEAYREFLVLRGNSGKFDEPRLGASYGSYLKIGDAMTFVHVTELKYNFVLHEINMVTY